MAAYVRSARRVNPVRLDEAEMLSRPVSPCEMLPAGIPGLVRVNGKTYTLTIDATLPDEGEPVVIGYRLACTVTYKAYDLPADLSTCDCPDHTFRRGTVEHPCCKHQLAMRRLLGNPS